MPQRANSIVRPRVSVALFWSAIRAVIRAGNLTGPVIGSPRGGSGALTGPRVAYGPVPNCVCDFWSGAGSATVQGQCSVGPWFRVYVSNIRSPVGVTLSGGAVSFGHNIRAAWRPWLCDREFRPAEPKFLSCALNSGVNSSNAYVSTHSTAQRERIRTLWLHTSGQVVQQE